MKGLPPLVLALCIFVAVGLIIAPDRARAQKSSVEHLVDDHAGSFSPNGELMVFERWFSTLRYGVDMHPVAKRAILLLMRPDGSGKRVLRHLGATFESDATFSPDGRSILFVRDERIYVMRRDGAGARPVRRDALEQACPRYSPDGSMISLWRGRGVKSGAYFVMNADGSGLRRISGEQRFAWGCPSWFPDGKQVVFGKDLSLYVASMDGTGIKRITDASDGDLYRPSVSPDGRWIACDGWLRGSGYGVVLLRANGTGVKRITTGANELQNDARASWSPDGHQIVFSGYRAPLEGAGVYVINRDGNGLRRLSNFPR